MLFQKKHEEGDNQGLSPDPRASISLPRPSLASRKSDGLPPRAVIAEGINILGCLQTDGEVQVDGEIDGDVRCAHLTVGKSGSIKGDITATEVVIRGRAKGAIKAQRVIIQEGAHVESDICHERFAIEEGAYFKGCCTPNNAPESGASAPSEAGLNRVVDDCEGTA